MDMPAAEESGFSDADADAEVSDAEVRDALPEDLDASGLVTPSQRTSTPAASWDRTFFPTTTGAGSQG